MKLTSSNLDEATFDPATSTLVIAFKNGGRYAHANVPQSTYDELISASSAGTYYAKYIRGKFATRKL